MGSVRLHTAVINNFMRSPGGPVAREMLRRGARVQAVAKILVGKRTGALQASIYLRPGRKRGFPTAVIGTPLKYGVYHHEGTGIYAGRGFIYPKRARVLRFVVGGRVVYARFVRGSQPNRFLVRALRAAA